MHLLNKILLNFLVTVISFYIYKSYSALNIVDLSELDSCPFCYGKTACVNLFNGNIKLNSTASNIFYNLLHLVINGKNTYYGSLKEGSRYKDIVVKKLAQNTELERFDSFVQTHVSGSNFSQIEKDFRIEIDKLFTSKENDVKLKLCPLGSSLDSLNKKHLMTAEDFIHFYTILYVNPEPIVLQILNASEGWPVPWFYGSCGRLAIFENVGTRLTSLLDSDWCQRVKLARDMLYLAYNMTYSHDKYSVYLTDISLDNLVVSSEGVLKIVDLEHTVVVDRMPDSTDLPVSWFEPHRTVHQPCDHCFIYSAEDLCSHRISDHNFYAVCKEGLSNSTALDHRCLLHSPPASLHGESALLSSLVESCINPPPGVLRKHVAAQIIETIELTLHEKC